MRTTRPRPQTGRGPRRYQVRVWLSEAELEAVNEAARLVGRSRSDLMRRAAIRAAERLMERRAAAK